MGGITSFNGIDVAKSMRTSTSRPSRHQGEAIISELLRDVMLIDLEDLCIVNPQNHCLYLALGYVWGPPGTKEAYLATK